MERSQHTPLGSRLSTAGRTLFSSDTLRISKASLPVFLYNFSVFLFSLCAFTLLSIPSVLRKNSKFFDSARRYSLTLLLSHLLLLLSFSWGNCLSLCTEYGSLSKISHPLCLGFGGRRSNITCNTYMELQISDQLFSLFFIRCCEVTRCWFHFEDCCCDRSGSICTWTYCCCPDVDPPATSVWHTLMS